MGQYSIMWYKTMFLLYIISHILSRWFTICFHVFRIHHQLNLIESVTAILQDYSTHTWTITFILVFKNWNNPLIFYKLSLSDSCILALVSCLNSQYQYKWLEIINNSLTCLLIGRRLLHQQTVCMFDKILWINLDFQKDFSRWWSLQ